MSVFKAQAHRRALKQNLSLTESGAIFTESDDTDGMPLLKIEKGGETIFAKFAVAGNAGRVDGLGLAQRAYSPHECYMLQSDAANGVDFELRARVLANCANFGMALFIYEDSAGQPASYSLAGKTLLAKIKADPFQPIMQSQ